MAVTNRDIFENSLALIGEDTEGADLEDYEERAPYLIASFCSANSNLDKKIRTVEGLEGAFAFSPVYLSLELDFPLCERLTSAAALYTAAMLVIDEDPELSDTLYDKYCYAISSTDDYYSSGASPQGAPMAACEPIKNVYFFN